jgi:superfamily II DNA or RNA helicase
MNYADLDLGYDRITIVPLDNVNVLMASMNDELLSNLKNHFTNAVAHARFTPAYKSGNWDGKIRFLKNDGILPRGLLTEAMEVMDKWGYKYDFHGEYDDSPVDISNFRSVVEHELIAKQDPVLTPRDYQWGCAEALLKNRRGIIKAATSSGKSYIIAMMIKFLHYTHRSKKTLLVVPRSDLVIQFQRDAINDYGFEEKDIGLFFGKIKDVDQPWIIATWQSLQNVEDREFFEQFDTLFVDEVHGAGSGDKKSKAKRSNGGTIMRQICDNCSNAIWRFGCTGTLPTDPLEVRTIISGLGPVVYEVKASDLMEEGHVTKLKITIPFISYDKKVVKEKIDKYLLEMDIDENTPKADIHATAKFNAEKKFIENYIPRLKLMSKIVKLRLSKDENVLILANSLNFGDKIKKVIEHLNKDEFSSVYYISGEMDEYKRKEIRELMETNKRVVVIATTSLFSTGISVKNLHTVIFGNIGKSKITTLQAIGRSLRQHTTKEYARVYDLCDNLKYNAKHAQERMQFYADEEFDIKIQEVTL